jgi:hypothetical protein
LLRVVWLFYFTTEPRSLELIGLFIDAVKTGPMSEILIFIFQMLGLDRFFPSRARIFRLRLRASILSRGVNDFWRFVYFINDPVLLLILARNGIPRKLLL